MKLKKNQLFKNFEKDVFLYIDNSLPKDKIDYWNQKLKEFPELYNCIEDYQYVSKKYNEANKVDLDRDKFNIIVDNVLDRKSIWKNAELYITKLFSSESEFAFGKIAFASALIIMAVVVSLISNRPNPVINLPKAIQSEILDWDANFVDNQIGRIEKLLKITKDEQYRKYYQYGLPASSIEKNIENINSNVTELKEEINNKEL